jgi:hypothetical protein
MNMVVGPARYDLPPNDATETQLTEWGANFVKSKGGIVHETTTAMNSRKGFPQHIYIHNNRMYFVEYIDETKKLNAAQEWWVNQLRTISNTSNKAMMMFVVRNVADARALANAIVE